MLFVGYSGNDRNVLAILSDIDEIIAGDGELIPNLYFLNYNPNITAKAIPQKEKVFIVNEREIRIKCIEAKDFEWVFSAFAEHKAVDNIHPKILRALLARTYKLVRSDIPRRSIEVDFDLISRTVTDDQELPKLYGVSLLDEPSHINIHFPYNLTEVGKQLGFSGWHGAGNLMSKIIRDTGIDIKATDNKYHITIKTGKSELNMYSREAVDLLKKVKDGMVYEVDI